MESIVRDFRYALRSLAKDRRFAFVAVFALAPGIGGSTVVFSVFYNSMFNAVAAKDAERLVVPVVADLEKPGYAGYDYQPWSPPKEYFTPHHVVVKPSKVVLHTESKHLGKTWLWCRS